MAVSTKNPGETNHRGFSVRATGLEPVGPKSPKAA